MLAWLVKFFQMVSAAEDKDVELVLCVHIGDQRKPDTWSWRRCVCGREVDDLELRCVYGNTSEGLLRFLPQMNSFVLYTKGHFLQCVIHWILILPFHLISYWTSVGVLTASTLLCMCFTVYTDNWLPWYTQKVITLITVKWFSTHPQGSQGHRAGFRCVLVLEQTGLRAVLENLKLAAWWFPPTALSWWLESIFTCSGTEEKAWCLVEWNQWLCG